MKLLNSLIFLLTVILGSSCNSPFNVESIEIERNFLSTDSSKNILFLGHIYGGFHIIDPRIECVNRSAYHHIWLGGDLCGETTKKESNLDYLDDLFDLDSPNTHWTLGNHDLRNGNESWITSRTKRKTFYTSHFKGITLLILNTSLKRPEDCAQLEAQFKLIQTVCDTIKSSSHLVVLMHDVTWGRVDKAIQVESFANRDGSWRSFLCGNVANRGFEVTVLPELIKVQKRGTEVICLAGDLGQKASTFEFTNEDGIVFLGSGITCESPYNDRFPTCGQRDTVLRFSHDTENRQLNWEFIDIEAI